MSASLPRVAQVAIGRFHHFHLARQLERHGMLEQIITGYPRFKLKDEGGIPSEKIRTFPWLQAPYMARGRFCLSHPVVDREWEWWARQTIDGYASRQLAQTDVLIALSGGGLHSGGLLQRKGGRYVCDRGSSHIRFQDEILREEYARWKVPYRGIDPRVIEKEEAEYQLADAVTIPSEFVKTSFLTKGVPEDRLRKIPYGARLDRFKPVGEPSREIFRALFVGQVSLRKGFLDLLHAFQKLRHPRKELLVIGTVAEHMKELFFKENLECVRFEGNISNNQLSQYYSSSSVFVLPSIEEGFGMVMGEAMACGCPVIASANTGAADLFTDGKEGFIVSIRSPMQLLEILEKFAEPGGVPLQMREAALQRVKEIAGWDTYGDRMARIIKNLS